MGNSQSGKAFEVLQKMAKSFFLPISILPFVGILLGIGASFTNPSTIASYHLEGMLGQGTVLHVFLEILKAVGIVVFGNLPLLFAMAVALGLAKQEKAVAVFAAAISFIAMHASINVLLTAKGTVLADGSILKGTAPGTITHVLGITSLELGVFGGIIAGLMVSYLHNRFYKIQLPAVISFFAGLRFVPIISILSSVLLGAVFFLVWPVIQTGIAGLGNIVVSSGLVGTFLFGCIERALIPFGLHHVFYIPIWQTALGGSMEVAGKMYFGAQNIYFAQLADPNTKAFSIDAVKFLVGKYPFMMGGLPGAALAMYHCVKKENRAAVKGLYLSAALTTFLTGITEPIEFTFLFLSPLLFGIHVLLAGTAFAACELLHIAVGTTFSDGLIDFSIFGILQGAAKTNYPLLIVLMLVYAVIYYALFRYLIVKWDVKIPGREDDFSADNAKLYTKADYQAKKNAAEDDERSCKILEGVGGVENVIDIDNCATRLRLTLADGTKVDEALLKTTGCSGVIRRGNAIQLIYGPIVSVLKSQFEEYVMSKCRGDGVVDNKDVTG
ncbi:phosphotransferase system eiib cysteine phosphorylation site [Lucifera butyrica]|uniref:Phosphotransferase system eiib cysteine phosphorylation site n=1 Tax=Lucifera butyrica TaxID=1351585 RepID=A0A498RD32_9FIRM|nr:PTS transporter subunit EIIC [Lucifera butyrica]VBB09361.1 phosphotransferase system eiib cysteine phosphorylation site [Lucifera butyrica]